MTEKPQQTSVPPPPAPEILVRTLNSDAASIARGDVDPRPELVSKETITAALNGPTATKKSHVLVKIIIGLVILAIIGLAVYLFVPGLSGGSTMVAPQ